MSDESPTTETQETVKEVQPSLSLLASEAFGSEFHGEVKETPQEETAEVEAVVAEETSEETTEESTEEVSEETTEESPEESTEEIEITSFSELVESQGWDKDWADKLEMPIKVDGIEGNVSLGELRASYQTQEAATKNLDEAKEKGRVQTQALTEKDEEATRNLGVTAALIERAEKLFEAETSSDDLAKLRESDPAEFAARTTEIANKRAEIDRLKTDAISNYQASTQINESEQLELTQQHLQSEGVKLLQVIPEWSDSKVASTEKAKIGAYLIESGFSQQDVSRASDHRLISLARKAMLFDEGQSKTKTATKKVVRIPKVAKPGKTKPTDQINQEKRNKLKSNLRKSGSLDDAYALLKSRNVLG